MRRAPPELVFLCDWLPPDFGAVGQYSLQRSREIAAKGSRVALYGLSSSRGSTEEEVVDRGMLRVVRIRTGTYDRASVTQRSFWTLRANLTLALRALRDLKGCREIVFTGSPPFLLHVVAPLNLLLRKKLTYRITDFFPEALMAGRERISWLLRLIHRLTLFWRRRVDLFEVLGEDQRIRLLESGIRPERIVLRRDPAPVSIRASQTPLQPPAALGHGKVLLYSGNFGAAHDYETFLGGYLRHHRAGSATVRLWLNARGVNADLVEKALAREQLPFHRSMPVALEQLASLLVTPAAHLITLRSEFWGYVLPSKVYGCIESGKDVIYIGPTRSDVHLVCTTRIRAARYWQIDVGDAEAVYRALEALGAM